MDYFYTAGGVIYWPKHGFTFNDAQWTPDQLDHKLAAKLGMEKVFVQPSKNHAIYPNQVLKTDGTWKVENPESLEQTATRLCKVQHELKEKYLDSVSSYPADAPLPVVSFRKEVESVFVGNTEKMRKCATYVELEGEYPSLASYPSKPFGY